MKKDPKVFLGHIFECIELIEIYNKEQINNFIASVFLIKKHIIDI